MKLLKILVLVLVVGGLGYGFFYFFFQQEDAPFAPPRFPRDALALEQEAEIRDGKAPFIIANLGKDLFFTQGLFHGKQGGNGLVLLRELFKGRPSGRLPEDLNNLAKLFFYLDLEHLARSCHTLYSPALQVLLQSYADGLTAGSQSAWTTQDVLLMQRGYAFLLGRNFLKEWTANSFIQAFGFNAFREISAYPSGNFGGIASQVRLETSVTSLFRAPLIETVRFMDNKGVTKTQTRTHPFLAFVFQPMGLELSNRFVARGLSLAGTPFLWSAATDRLTFIQQPILVNDEQFHQVPTSTFLGRTGTLFHNREAGKDLTYNDIPVHAPYGRRITPVLVGSAGMDYFWYWDGLRPSADLAALYYLLEAGNMDEAISALQYHQVPAVQLTLFSPGASPITMRVLPGNPERAESRLNPKNKLFQRPFIQMGQLLLPLKGIDFQSQKTNPVDPQGRGVSQLDRRLAALLHFYLEGPMMGGSMPDRVREGILEILDNAGLQDRDYFLQLVWKGLLASVHEDYFLEPGPHLIQASNLAVKRFLLASLGLEQTGSLTSGPLNTGVRLLETQLEKAWNVWLRASRAKPPYPFLLSRAGGPQEIHLPLSARSRDGVPGSFWVRDGNHISRMATFTLVWDHPFYLRAYADPSSGDMGKTTKEIPSRNYGKSVVIKPKI